MSTLTVEVVDSPAFDHYDDVFQHIYNTLFTLGIVKASYLSALREREADYPTGIELDGYAIAIPHCGSEHANHPAIYILRMPQPLQVNQADGDGTVEVKLIINLVVTDPADQLQLLKALFSHLQNKDFYMRLLELPIEEAKSLFVSTIIQ